MLETYLRMAAEKLKSGVKVYLCPAAMETVIIAKMLKAGYGAVPSGFCDNDVRKQGRRLHSMPEFTIHPFDEVLRDETAEFLVVSPHHSAEMIGSLIFERGVSEKRILNFQPVEKRKTCPLMAQNWIVEDRHFVCCCIEEYKPRFDNKNCDPREGLDYLDRIRKQIIDGQSPLPEGCRQCFTYHDTYIYSSLKLNSFDFSFRGWCNYKCEYCSANHPDWKGYNDRFSLEEYLIELERRGLSNDIFSVLFAVGEPTLNEKRFGLYEHCRERQYFLDVFSNCSVFDEELFKLAGEIPVIIRKSFDAGTPETYAKIKGVDRWEKMLGNVERYLEAPYLALNPKYLFVPNVNDNEKDIKGFAKMCAGLPVDFVTPVFSFLDDRYAGSAHAQEMFKLLVDELAANGIFTANVDTLYSESYHDLYRASF
ncbi:radical SAM protein [uncultured Oscillibacter sp.]|uniref:radical SAM protein n=1 Tax=uncultured Oscillibacter sp. TaxID=876091 RepID=UPI0025F66F59|nr:radical SAM protein [uncultured Oscillibacter sp.]